VTCDLRKSAGQAAFGQTIVCYVYRSVVEYLMERFIFAVSGTESRLSNFKTQNGTTVLCDVNEWFLLG
jgi:hypothetical protein